MKISIQLTRHAVQIIVLLLAVLGLYDTIKPVTIVFLAGTIVFGNFFCGWFCPFGTMQEVFGKLGSLIFKKKFKMPYFIQKYLQFSRIIIMILMVVGVAELFFTDINAYLTFFNTIELKQLVMTTAVIMMLSFLFIALFFERPFCSYLCTEGVKFSILNLPRIFSIKRNQDICVDCKICDKNCPMNIEVSSTKNVVRNMQCINCFKCISSCPKKGALTYSKYIWWKKEK